MATIRDVAREAGVSPSTVSYALSGKRTISRETRERIDEAIADLGFTVNAGARALATSQTMVIGLLTQFHQDEFAPAMLQYMLPVSDTARELGYDILLVTETDATGRAAPHHQRRAWSTASSCSTSCTTTRVSRPLRAARPARSAGRAAEATPKASTSSTSTSASPPACSSTSSTASATARSSSSRRRSTCSSAAAPTAGVSAMRRSSARPATDMQMYPYYGESQQPAIGRSMNAILDAPTQRDRADRAQRRHDRRAAVGARGAGHPRARRPLGRQPLLQRLRSSVLAAVHGRGELARSAGPARRSGNWCGGSPTRNSREPPVTRFIAPELTVRGSTR